MMVSVLVQISDARTRDFDHVAGGCVVNVPTPLNDEGSPGIDLLSKEV